jgi:uncharacterized protein (DUF2164 family)
VSKIELPKATQEALARSLRKHLKDSFDLDIEPFDALALLDHIGETMGPHFYNQGLNDAQELIRKKLEIVIDEVYGLEKPTKS